MADIAAVAERLRLVRGARRKFMRLWAIDRTMIDSLVDRLAIDLGGHASSPLPLDGGAGAGGAEQDSAAHPDAPPVDES